MSQRNVVLLLPGQGAQRVGMGFGLYGTDPVFTASMDGLLDASLRRVWLSGGCSLDDGVVAQPLLFAFGYSLGRALLSWGVRPSVLLGHSVGELACAALAGVWPACSIRRLVAERTAVLGGAPDGGMLAIGAGVDEVRRLLPVGVAVAAVNSPRQVVVSGTSADLVAVSGRCREVGVASRAVPARQPFHHPVLGPLAADFAVRLGRIPARAPVIPVQSTRTAALVGPEQAVAPEFWAGQLVRPVLFWAALDGVLRSGEHVVVDASPGQVLGVLARQHPAVRCGRVAVLSPREARQVLVDVGDDLGRGGQRVDVVVGNADGEAFLEGRRDLVDGQ